MAAGGVRAGPVEACATPGAGAFPDVPAKKLTEVCLVDETAVMRNLTQRRVGGQHQLLSALDSTPDDVRDRRIAESSPESPTEMSPGQAHNTGKTFECDAATQIAVDV